MSDDEEQKKKGKANPIWNRLDELFSTPVNSFNLKWLSDHLKNYGVAGAGLFAAHKASGHGTFPWLVGSVGLYLVSGFLGFLNAGQALWLLHSAIKAHEGRVRIFTFSVLAIASIWTALVALALAIK